MNTPSDRRLTPATGRVAHDSLRGVLERPAYVPGRPMRMIATFADLCREPHGARDRQVNFGADLTVIDEEGDWSFVQAAADGYCGWVLGATLGPATTPITDRITAPATHIYSAPDLKTRETGWLSIGARLSVTSVTDRFAQLATGGWVPLQHLGRTPATDPADVALGLVGTPYLWGGNSRAGIDCSGLVQAALAACAQPCPGDSDLQERAFPSCDDIRCGDLLFWPGHVALTLDGDYLIHATAHVMAVTIEPIAAVIERIEAMGEGPFLGARRPKLTPAPVFP